MWRPDPRAGFARNCEVRPECRKDDDRGRVPLRFNVWNCTSQKTALFDIHQVNELAGPMRAIVTDQEFVNENFCGCA
jgi:hypothetical protein